MKLFTKRFGNASFVHALPDPDDLTFHASAEFDAIDGSNLHEVWPQIVRATHPDFAAYFPDVKLDEKTFFPLDLDRFMAIRCRAVSALEQWGPNVNGDGFPEEQLIQSHRSLWTKGFYVEHQSFNPDNAVGIIAHAEWVPAEKYVLAVALVDKVRNASLANHMRDMLKSKRAGVSIGCIAGEAECSICGNIARKKHQLCAHMNKGNPHYIKGRRVPLSRVTASAGGIRRFAWEKEDGHRLAYDICRKLYFYELSYTKAPADRDALSHVIRGSILTHAEEKGREVTTIDVPSPDAETLDKWTDRAVHDAFMTRYKKMVKDEVYRKLEEDIKKGLVKLRPMVQEVVEEKKTEIKEGITPMPIGAGK
jgi:hypothetical protein